MTPHEIAARAHAFLFAEGEPLTLKKLSQLCECDESALASGLDALSGKLETTGLALLRTEKEAALLVSPTVRDAVAHALERDEERDIGDAGLEVIAILLYEGPSTRADIDYIRGVNSSSTIRTLLARGLVERAGNPHDGREYVYAPTIQLLAHLGVRNTKELPDYATIAQELSMFKVTAHGDIKQRGDGSE